VTGVGAWQLIRIVFQHLPGLLLDAAVTSLCPNHSTQASFALMNCAVTWYLRSYEAWMAVFPISVALVCPLAAFFALGVLKTESSFRTLEHERNPCNFIPSRLFLGCG